MSTIWNLLFLISLSYVIGPVVCAPKPEETEGKEKEPSDSSEGESVEIEKGTVSPAEMEKLKEEIIENQEENAEKFDLPLTSSPEKVETFLKEEEKEYGKELPDAIEEGFTDGGDLKTFVHFVELFDKVENEGKEDEEIKEKTPAEMRKMKEEVYKLNNERNEKHGLPEVSQEEYDKVWNQKKEEYGEQFPGKVAALISLLKAAEEKESATVEVVESVPEGTTEKSETSEEEEEETTPTEAFIVKNAKGKICILAKFHSDITITYAGKSSEQKVEVTVPKTGNTKGKCGGPNRAPSMQISWGKFIFALNFNKTSEDTWGVTLVELTYDMSEPLFDGADYRDKVTAKSKIVNLFEAPIGKSYFCPGQEVILLYNEDQHVATVQLKEVHLQPYDVEDGKFSSSHRCSKVVIGGPDEEPFVQDETVPLAVGCTLALITLLILVGFSVHRAYNAKKPDYNTME